MPEPIIPSDHLVVEWDDAGGGWSGRDFIPGPAGTAGIELPGGIEVDVDVAAPFTLAGLWLPGDTDRSIATALLGADRATLLLGDRADRTLRQLPDRSPFRREPPYGTDRSGGVDEQLARLALAAAVDEPGRSDLVRGLAALDQAAALLALADRLPLGRRPAELATRAVEVLLTAQPWELRRVSAYELAARLREVVPVLDPTLAERVHRLAADVEREREALPAAAAMAAPVAAGRGGAERAMRPAPVAPVLDAVDRRLLPERFAGAGVVARATTPSEIELRVGGHGDGAGGWWARAFDRNGVVVAAAPLRAVQRDAVARLLVPPALLSEVEVDVTDAPGLPQQRPSLRAVVDAVRVGQTAARAERLGDPRRATQRWLDTAKAWEQSGDPARAGLAGEYARGSDRGRRVGQAPPLLADSVLDADS